MEGQEEQGKKTNAKVLRTYSSDMAEAVRTNEMSVIKIAMAEKEKREQEELFKKVEGTKTSKFFFAIAGIIVVGVAIWGSSYVLEKKKEKEEALLSKNETISTFINYDNSYFVDATNTSNVVGLVSSLKNEEGEEKGGISAYFFTERKEEGKEVLDKDKFLSILDTTAPSSLIRALTPEFLFGKYLSKINPSEGSSLFLIFEINDYGLAYASMLDWEKSMFKDLIVLFDINISDSDNALFEKEWKDVIVNNKDARVLYGENGESVLLYSFINKNNLVITKNNDTLKEIISQIFIKSQ